MTEPAQRRLVERAIQQLRPLLLLVGFPCTLWNLLNENCYYSHRMEELEALREMQRPLLRWTCQQIKKQAEIGNFFIFESSQSCRIWGEACVAELCELPDAQVVVADAGALAQWITTASPSSKPQVYFEQLQHGSGTPPTTHCSRASSVSTFGRYQRDPVAGVLMIWSEPFFEPSSRLPRNCAQTDLILIRCGWHSLWMTTSSGANC